MMERVEVTAFHPVSEAAASRLRNVAERLAARGYAVLRTEPEGGVKVVGTKHYSSLDNFASAFPGAVDEDNNSNGNNDITF
jgi:predicted CoA-binding protein